jgi:hypothetical protein
MYDDGPGGNNLDCRTGTSRLCWGHRDNILNRFSGHASCPGAPTDAVFTWAKAKKLLHIR